MSRHKQELRGDGYKVLSKKDFRNLHDASFKIPNRGLAIFPRRSVLRIGMLLQNSLVAKLVRSYLLNVEESFSPQTQETLQHMVRQLDQHAEQLIENASRLTEQAHELKDHARQLHSQTRMMKAVVDEIYVNRDYIKRVDAEVQSNRDRIKAIEIRGTGYITPEQIEILRKRVKKKGKATVIWAKFREHFGISRYTHLPRERFEEALDWLVSF